MTILTLPMVLLALPWPNSVGRLEEWTRAISNVVSHSQNSPEQQHLCIWFLYAGVIFLRRSTKVNIIKVRKKIIKEKSLGSEVWGIHGRSLPILMSGRKKLLSWNTGCLSSLKARWPEIWGRVKNTDSKSYSRVGEDFLLSLILSLL